MSFSHRLISYFLPTSCLSCRSVLPNEPQNFLCQSCSSKVKFLREPLCVLCGDPFSNQFLESHLCGDCLEKPPSFEGARSMFELQDTISKIIYSFKYHANEAVLPWFRSVFSESMQSTEIHQKFDYIIPVPLHPFRLIRRGYNQSLLLAKEIGKIWKIPVEYKTLIRKNYEKAQSLKNREERKRKIRNLFFLKDEKKFKDKLVLLVDDVYTTGATVEECAKILKKGGAKVYVFTLARTPLRNTGTGMKIQEYKSRNETTGMEKRE